jgi:hypothetical protein
MNLRALLSGDRVHVAEFEDVSVGVGELTLVHEAAVRGGMRLRAARSARIHQDVTAQGKRFRPRSDLNLSASPGLPHLLRYEELAPEASA